MKTNFDPDRLLSWPIAPVTQTYSARDTILYALGVGAGQDELTLGDDLAFVYEKNLVAFPTMAVTLASPAFWVADPEVGIDWMRMLHGEQSLVLHRTLPPAGTVRGQDRVAALYDKGSEKGAVMLMERSLTDLETGELLATVRSTVMLRGNGGFGGRNDGPSPPHVLPADRVADLIVELKTRSEQALLYRLSGDHNPLHVDPVIAAEAGFPKPILHGLCSYAIAGRALSKTLCANQAQRLRRLDVRFSAPVFPGETLRTEIWRESPERAAFRVTVVERNVVVLNNGYAEFVS